MAVSTRMPVLLRVRLTSALTLFFGFAIVGVVSARTVAISPPLYQSSADADLARSEAQARKATAEADRAELLARLPPSTSRPLPGTIDTHQFGAAGLVKAFDLARQLAAEVCTVLPADRKTVIHDPQSAAGVAAARIVSDGIARLTEDTARQNQDLQLYIDTHTPPGTKISAISMVVLAAVPATVKAVADVTSLFKTDVTASGIAYGEGARDLFATSMVRACPDKVAGLGAGYLGELDPGLHDKLLAKVRTLAAQRAGFANRIAIVQKLADGAKGDEKRDMAGVASAAAAALRTVDGFIESLKAGEASDKSPLFNAARYLGYAARTANALVLDFDLRLEGMSIVKDNLFTGQHLRLSGVALLWYRLYEPNGALRAADAVRRMAAPVDVDLRGTDAGGEFWGGR